MGTRRDERGLVNGATENIQYRNPRETDPLLKPEAAVKTSRFSRPSSWNWKNLVVSVCLWVTYLICSIAYSIIAPFFPDEVRLDANGSTAIWKLYFW